MPVRPSQIWPEIIKPYAPFLDAMPRPSAGPFDEPCVMVLVNMEWRGYILGALEVLAQRDAWVGTPAEIDAQLELVDLLIAHFIGDEMSCFDEMMARLDALIECCRAQAVQLAQQVNEFREVLAARYDGTPQSITPDAPDLTWTTATGDPPGMLSVRQAALCAAVYRFLGTMRDFATRQVQIGMGIGLVGSGLVSIINPIAGLLVGLAAGAISALNQAAIDDQDAHKKVACCMYDALEGAATIDFDTFAASLDSCPFDYMTHEEGLRQAYMGGLNDEVNYLAFVNALGEETRAAEIYGGDARDCDCQYDWYQEFYFPIDEQGWEATINDLEGPDRTGTHTSGEGWYPVDVWALPANDYQRYVRLSIVFPYRIVRRIRMFYDGDPGTYDSGQDVSAQILTWDGATIKDWHKVPFAGGQGQQVTLTAANSINQVWVYARACYRSTTPSWDGNVRLWKITMEGDGENPFAT